MEFLKIVGLAVAASVLYGVLQDQVMVRVCLEYVTVGHTPVFATDNPALLALGQGVRATWWWGLMFGVPLALCARWGARPKLTAGRLVLPVGFQLAAVAVSSLAAGAAGYVAASSGAIVLIEDLAARVPREQHVLYLASRWADVAAGVSGAITGILVCWQAWVRRGRLDREQGG